MSGELGVSTMDGGAAVRDLLDQLAGSWEQAGAGAGARLAPGRPEQEVRAQFSELGFDPVPELVELYSWREPGDLAGLFWEADLVGLDTAVDVWRQNRSVLDGHPDWRREADEMRAWPGPVAWFPALVGVGNSGDCLMMDNSTGPDRGSLWWVSPSENSERILESLTEGLLAARYCVQAGLWTFEEPVVVCARDHQPWRHDRVHPPWCDQHH